MRKARAKPKVVLCVGSEPVRLNRRGSWLRKHGWEVLSSGNIHDGLQQFAKQAIHLVVLDVNGETPDAALSTAGFKQLRPEIPVIVLIDGNASGGDLSWGDAVVKCDDVHALLEAIQRLTGKA